jgi:hypothetical protein
LHQVEKYYLLLPKNKQKTSLLKKQKAANMPYITEDGLVDGAN